MLRYARYVTDSHSIAEIGSLGHSPVWAVHCMWCTAWTGEWPNLKEVAQTTNFCGTALSCGHNFIIRSAYPLCPCWERIFRQSRSPTWGLPKQFSQRRRPQPRVVLGCRYTSPCQLRLMTENRWKEWCPTPPSGECIMYINEGKSIEARTRNCFSSIKIRNYPCVCVCNVTIAGKHKTTISQTGLFSYI